MIFSEEDEYIADEPLIVIEKHSSGIGGLLLGVAIGAGVALLFAPRSGQETRREIRRGVRRVGAAARDRVRDVADQVVGTVDEARRSVEEGIDGARMAVELKGRQMRQAVRAGRLAAAQAREQLERRIAEEKASVRAAGDDA